MFRSIRWRLILSSMFVTLLAVGVVGLITYQLVLNNLAQMEYDSLVANAEAVAQQAYPLIWPQVRSSELQQLCRTAAFLGDVQVQVLDRRQHILADSSQSDEGEWLVLLIPSILSWSSPESGGEIPGATLLQIGPGDFIQLPAPFLESLPPGVSVTVIQRDEGLWGGHFTFEEVIPGDTGTIEVHGETTQTDRSNLVVAVPVGEADKPVGYVQLSEPPALNVTLLRQLRQALLIAGIGAVVVAGLFGLWNSQRLASPLKNLAETSARMGSGDLSVRADVRSGDEIGKLAVQFNQMAANLQTSFDQLAVERDALRRFMADASHELRTPITALKNFNALLLDSAANDPEARAEFLAESQVQIERLEWITRNLLDLSRRDAGLLAPEKTDNDMVEIIQAAVAPFKPAASEKRINLVASVPEKPVSLSCDRTQIEMALSNLLDNALKFTPEGGDVTVSLKEADEQILVSVRDSGEGIQPEDLPHIFERFYRGHNHAEKGSGLGLAIVKSIIEAHGGAVSVESTAGKGTSLTLTFPLAASS